MSAAVTVGIDLASQPKNTAMCFIAWKLDHACVVGLRKGVMDDGITPLKDAVLVSAMQGRGSGLPAPVKVAIDAPLGWPVDFMRGMRDPTSWPVEIDGDRRRLERRATDHWIREVTGKQPLSVTTDRIAYAAMRAAGILAHYSSATGQPVDRSGVEGIVCEVYPDPSIRRLQLWPEGVGSRVSYKVAATDLRGRIVAELGRVAPWLVLTSEQQAACVDSDDCLDALVCALVARAAAQGLTRPPPAALMDEARAEGWIHLPEPGAVHRLLPTTAESHS